MTTNDIDKLNTEIDLFNKLGLEHPNTKYIKSTEFINVLFDIVSQNTNNYETSLEGGF